MVVVVVLTVRLLGLVRSPNPSGDRLLIFFKFLVRIFGYVRGYINTVTST